jgi:16S rRNA (guanine966-N2)-methyltransferase
MRIIAGYLGGRNFDSTAKATHPMSEKMRGAIFNALGDLSGLCVLDAFSGSGAISFEAISRGAKNSLAIESNKQAQSDIDKNIDKLRVKNVVKLVKANVYSWALTDKQTFDIIIADPPYDSHGLGRVAELELKLGNSGTLVLSMPPDSAKPDFKNLIVLVEKSYGDSMLVFYKNNL